MNGGPQISAEEQHILPRSSLEKYGIYLKDKSRPPSKGGNTKAWHQHVISVAGVTYSFLALGAKKWAFSSDQITFRWSWGSTERYRNIDSETLEVWDKAGNPVIRGIRGFKPWRTAETRLPARRSEWKD